MTFVSLNHLKNKTCWNKMVMWMFNATLIYLAVSDLRGCVSPQLGHIGQFSRRVRNRSLITVPYHRSDATISFAILFCWLDAFRFLEQCWKLRNSLVTDTYSRFCGVSTFARGQLINHLQQLITVTTSTCAPFRSGFNKTFQRFINKQRTHQICSLPNWGNEFKR